MIAAGRVLKGEPAECPRWKAATLRYYFHMIDRSRGTGTIWVWCPNCNMTCHLPRVSPAALRQEDPFAELGLDEFAALETDPREGLLDMLDRMWNQGTLR